MQFLAQKQRGPKAAALKYPRPRVSESVFTHLEQRSQITFETSENQRGPMNTYRPRNTTKALKKRRKLQRDIMASARAAADKDDRRDASGAVPTDAAARNPQ